MTHATVSIDAVAENVRYHCAHDGGRHAYRLTAPVGDVTAYLAGTDAEVRRFAEALLAAVNADVPA